VFGISGQWATLDYTPNVTRTIPAAPTVTLEQAFVGSSCKIKWAAVDGAVRYKVEVWAASTLRRTVSLGNVLRYDYTSQDATADGGPWRDVTFKVSAINATAVEGPQGTLNANNPAPAALSGLSVTGGWESLFFKCTKPTDQDFANILIYISTASGFTPDADSLVYQGPANTVTIDRLNNGTLLVGGTNYYLRAAASDLFGSTGLNMSSELTAQPLSAAGAIKPGDIVETMLADLAVGPNKLNIDIGGGNLCQNSSFEVDSNADGFADGCGDYNNTHQPISYSRVAGRRGGYAQRVEWWDGNTSTKGIAFASPMRPLKTYVLSIYARASGSNIGEHIDLYWNVYPASAVAITVPALTSDFQRYAWRLVQGATVDTKLYISISYGGGTVGTLDFDDLQIEEGDVLTGYSDSFIDVNSAINTAQSAAVTAQETATASQNSINAKYTLKVQAGNFVAGVSLSADAGGGESAMVLLADKFAFAAPSAGVGSPYYYPFVMGTVNGVAQAGINGNLVVDGGILTRHLAANTITTDKIVVGAVSAASSVSGLNYTRFPTNVSTWDSGDLDVLTMSTTGGLLSILGSAKVMGLTLNGVAFVVCRMYIHMDGGGGYTRTIFDDHIPVVNSSDTGYIIAATRQISTIYTALAAGAHSIKIQLTLAFCNASGALVSVPRPAINIDMTMYAQENKV
jgi:hypothetical protein